VETIRDIVIKALNERADDIASSDGRVDSLEICWSGMASFEMVAGQIKYRKYLSFLPQHGFEEYCKKIGDYTVGVFDSESDLSLTIINNGKFDLQKVHDKLKAQIPVLKPKTYKFKYEDVDNADIGGIPVFYEVNLLRSKHQIEYFIARAKTHAKKHGKTFDANEQKNLCLGLIKYSGGMAIYQDHKEMWQNITSNHWTPESLDTAITNLRKLAPVFESI